MERRLRRCVILYEAEAACRDRLIAAGTPAATAAEIAFYLAQGTDFAGLVEPATAAFAAAGVELRVLPLDAVERWLPLLQGPDRHSTLLWCLTDGFTYYRGSAAASVAALLGVPQFGSPPEAQHLAQDKFRCIALAQALGLRTPPTALVENGVPLSPLDVLPEGGPLFVKPNRLGAKLGIAADSRADRITQALALTRRIHGRYGDQALVQAFVPGRDVRASFLDLGRPAVPLGLHAVDAGDTRGFPTLADSRRVTRLKAADATLRLANLRDEPALAGAVAALEEATAKLARVVPMRDCFALDFRLDAEGRIWFLELEVCPAITIYDFLTYLKDAYGTDLAGAMVEAATAAFARRSP